MIIPPFNPLDFKITKRQSPDYEPELQQAIDYWLTKVCKKKNIDRSDDVWVRYPEIVINVLVQWNDRFPLHIPVGYVLVCYLNGLTNTGVKMKDHRYLFEKFIKTGTNRQDLYDAYKSGKVLIWNDEQTEMETATTALYQPPT